MTEEQTFYTYNQKQLTVCTPYSKINIINGYPDMSETSEDPEPEPTPTEESHYDCVTLMSYTLVDGLFQVSLKNYELVTENKSTSGKFNALITIDGNYIELGIFAGTTWSITTEENKILLYNSSPRNGTSAPSNVASCCLTQGHKSVPLMIGNYSSNLRFRIFPEEQNTFNIPPEYQIQLESPIVKYDYLLMYVNGGSNVYTLTPEDRVSTTPETTTSKYMALAKNNLDGTYNIILRCYSGSSHVKTSQQFTYLYMKSGTNITGKFELYLTNTVDVRSAKIMYCGSVNDSLYILPLRDSVVSRLSLLTN